MALLRVDVTYQPDEKVIYQVFLHDVKEGYTANKWVAEFPEREDMIPNPTPGEEAGYFEAAITHFGALEYPAVELAKIEAKRDEFLEYGMRGSGGKTPGEPDALIGG